MKKVLLLLLSVITLVFCVGCKAADTTEEGFYVTEMYLSTYNDAVHHTSNNAEIYYLSEEDERNNRLTVIFNKDISEDNESFLFYIQTGTEIPVVPEGWENEVGYDIYRISGNTLEIHYSDDRSPYYTPMLYSALYIPQGFKAKDGSTLDNPFEAYFSGANPHSLLENVTSYNDSECTLAIPAFTKGWEPIYGKSRRVGFINFENVPVYSGGVMVDTLTISDNVEITGEEDGFYEVNIYRPLSKGDANHHSKYTLKGASDVLESPHVNKISGKVQKEYVNLIAPSDECSVVTVLSTNELNYYELSEVYVIHAFFPSGGSTHKIWEDSSKERALAEGEEIDSIKNYKPLSEIEIDEALVENLHKISLGEYIFKYGSGWITLGRSDGKPGMYPMETPINHFTLTRYPEKRDTVEALHKLYISYIDTLWNKVESEQKEKFEAYKFAMKTFSEIWYEWSRIDENVTRESYVNLVKKHFIGVNGITEDSVDQYFMNDGELVENAGTFKENLFFPKDLVNEARENLDMLVTEPQAIGGYSELNRQFIDPVNDIHYVIDLRGKEVYDWSDEVYNKMPRELRHSFPPLYWAIKEFDVTKEELISVKDPKLTLEIIDALYLEEEEMKKALASDLALVYDGDVYCYYDIMGLWGDEASKNTKSSLKKEIPESVKKEYSEKMKAYFIEMAGESYYNKIYKSQLESFLGVVSDSEKVTD